MRQREKTGKWAESYRWQTQRSIWNGLGLPFYAEYSTEKNDYDDNAGQSDDYHQWHSCCNNKTKISIAIIINLNIVTIAEVNSRITAAESRILAIEDHLSQLTSVVNKTESDTPISTTLAAELVAMRTETRESLLLSNDNEQYSRRNNLRICGIKPDEGENCRITAVKFMKNILRLADINIADVETAHMTAGSQQSSLGQRKRPTMLIRFYSRDKRDYVIKNRKVLKGTHYAKTMNRLRNNEDVRTTWSWNGKFFAILSNGKKVTVKPFQPISELLAN